MFFIKLFITLFSVIFLALASYQNIDSVTETVVVTESPTGEHISITEGKRLIKEYEQRLKNAELDLALGLFLETQNSANNGISDKEILSIAYEMLGPVKYTLEVVNMEYVDGKILSEDEINLTYNVTYPDFQKIEISDTKLIEIIEIPAEEKEMKFTLVKHNNKWYIDGEKSDEIFDAIPVVEIEVD